MTASVVDAVTARLALTRAQIAALLDYASRGDAPADRLDELRTAGAIDHDGEVNPVVRPVVRTLSTARARGALRRWVAGVQPVVEIFAGPYGVVVLPAGPDPDIVQDVVWQPRRSALARLLAGLLDLPSQDGPAVFGTSPRPWSELVGLASQPDTGLGLADLRWADDPRGPLGSVLVVGWHAGGGIAEVLPAGSGRVRCEGRHPLEVWTALTLLTRHRRVDL